MNLIIGLIVFFLGRRLYNWYGYEKGKLDDSYWKPIHANQKINLLVTIISFLFMLVGLSLIIYSIIILIF